MYNIYIYVYTHCSTVCSCTDGIRACSEPKDGLTPLSALGLELVLNRTNAERKTCYHLG